MVQLINLVVPFVAFIALCFPYCLLLVVVVYVVICDMHAELLALYFMHWIVTLFYIIYIYIMHIILCLQILYYLWAAIHTS